MAKPKPTPRPKKRGRRAAFWLGALAVGAGGLWVGIHEIPWLGPALADGGRAVLGPEAIAWSEDVAYGLADTVNVWLHGDDAPTTFWEPPSQLPVAAVPPSEVAAGTAPPALPSHFPPPGFSPPHAKVAATGDGSWAPMIDPRHPDAPPLLYRTSVHPDPRRPFAAIAVVALDLASLDLRFLPGTHEPESNKVPRASRSGQLPTGDYANVLAAWNGGFKAIHGHYGMRIEEQLFLPPRDIACTVGLFRDGRVELGTWSTLKAEDAAMWAYRQTPPCLVEQGKTHTGLDVEYNRNWGAAVDGETIIRRSALGIDPERKVLFYGLGEAVTAQSMGRGMLAVGAATVAQLDINYSYPRFLVFGGSAEEPRVREGLIKDLKWKAEDYTVEPSTRDFFYVVRKKPVPPA